MNTPGVLRPFRFSDPQQKKIYEELSEVIGPGPAAFFRDACWIMENEGVLLSASHIVGHLLRELESALRAALKPMVEEEGARQEKQSHKNEIMAILQALEIGEESPEARAWFELADRLAGLAHRSGLGPPRPAAKIRDLWEKAQSWLLILLDRIRNRYSVWIQIIDELAEKPKPGKEDVRRLRRDVPNTLVTRSYFFDHLRHPGWLEPLSKEGFFRNPPMAERDEEQGIIRFPPWPEARYLARMAQHEPELVAKIIRDMPDTDNAWIQQELVDAALAMPTETAAQLVEKVRGWAGAPYLYPLLPEKIGQFMACLAEAGRTAEALDIAEALLEPRARFDVWTYEQILADYYAALVRAAGLPTLERLCDLLERAIGYAGPHGDQSLIWRAAIEDHDQNKFNPPIIENALVSGVRDAAALLVREGRATIKEVVEALEKRQGRVFQRIILHLLALFADQAMSLVASYLTKRELFDDVQAWHECALLIRKCFGNLEEKDRQLILSWIERDLKKQTFLLARIDPENLPPDWKKRHRALVQEHGEPKRPEFPYCFFPRFDWGAGRASPKTADELRAMFADQILEFLKTWMPPASSPGELSQAELAQTLSVLAAEDPDRFAKEALRFEELNPAYIQALLSGLRNGMKNKAFEWEPVLDLCQRILEVHGRIRWDIGHLLWNGLQEGPGEIPFNLREKVWNILKGLAKDPDPTPEYERQYGGSNMDPATLSLNTTRGVAMHAIIHYGLWARRRIEPGEIRGFDKMPEVQDALEAHLDPEREPSLAIRAVYGWHFPQLVFLDDRWARDNAARIFPMDPGKEAFFEAAWGAYITAWKPDANVLDILAEQYRHAVERIGSWQVDICWPSGLDKKLTEHLMVFYSLGKLSLEDSMLMTFWKKAPDDLRWHAIRFVGLGLQESEGEIPAEVLDRLRKLWEARLEAVKGSKSSSEFAREMSAFSGWFASRRFDVKWAIDRLCESLQVADETDDCHMVLELLSETVKTCPIESIRCFRLIAQLDRDGWRLYAGRDSVRKILKSALESSEAGKEAREVINYLGSRGFFEFLDLLKMG